MQDIQTSADTVAAKAASAAQWGGSGVSIVTGGARVFGLTTDEWTVVAAIVGMVVGVAGLVLSWYFKHEHLKLAKLNAGMVEVEG